MDRSTKPSFNFVNLKHPDDLKDEETQLRIRRLAMTEVGKARRKPKTKRERNEIVLQFRSPSEQQLNINRLGSGSVDPFTSFPIELDNSDRALIAHIFSPDTNHASQLRGCWYPVGLSSAAAFHNMLANSQNFIIQKVRGYFPSQDDGVALVHHHKSLREASEIMKDPKRCRSDEMLGTIASFMCHLALLNSFPGDAWDRHRNALLKIVSLRGGFDAIQKESLRITLSWADLMGAFTQDLPPAIPLPHKWELDGKSPPNTPRPSSPVSLIWKREFPMKLDWISIFDDIVQLISLDHAFSEEQVTLAINSGCWMEPTLWRLLSIRPLLQGSEREHVIEEVCRLGTLLFLAPVWRMLGHVPVWTAAISRKLMLILSEHMIEWKELKPLLLWVLYFAAVETQDLGERSQLVFMLAVLMSGLQLTDWDQLMQTVKGVLWIEKICATSDDLIRDEVMAILARNSMRATVELTTPVLPDFLLDDFEPDVADENV